jgi:hypothetical protein
MTKIRMTGMPNDYGLVEETDLNVMNATRRIPIKRRLLADDEKIYGIQRLWTSTNSKFVLVKKAEYTETNNNKAFTDKFLFRSLTRQKSIDRGSHEGKKKEKERQIFYLINRTSSTTNNKSSFNIKWNINFQSNYTCTNTTYSEKSS